MAAQTSRKTASLTTEERTRLFAVVTQLGLGKTAKAMRAGAETLNAAMSGDPLLVATRNRLIASLAAVEVDLEDGHVG